GISESEIKQRLKAQGASDKQIEEAMASNQIKSAVEQDSEPFPVPTSQQPNYSASDNTISGQNMQRSMLNPSETNPNLVSYEQQRGNTPQQPAYTKTPPLSSQSQQESYSPPAPQTYEYSPQYPEEQGYEQ